MFSAVAFGFADSVNALLIAVIVAIGIMLPRGRYRKVAPLLILGDWLGVYLLALAVMALFNGLQDWVQTALASPWFGIILIAVGALTVVLTWRARPEEDNRIVDMMLKFLYPLSPPGRGFQWARENPQTVSKGGGYLVALFLIVLGVLHL